MRLTINDFNFEKAITRQGASYTGTGTLARYNGNKMNEEWVYSGSTVALQWLYSGSTTNKRRT